MYDSHHFTTMDDERWERRVELIKLLVPLGFAGLGVFLITIAVIIAAFSSKSSDRLLDKIFDSSNNLILLGGGALTAGGLGTLGRRKGNVTTVNQEFQGGVDNAIAPTPGTTVNTSDYYYNPPSLTPVPPYYIEPASLEDEDEFIDAEHINRE